MRVPALLIGVILLLAGGAIVSGLFKWQETEKVADIGPIEINKTETRKAPLNLGWVLLGAGAVAVVFGAISKK